MAGHPGNAALGRPVRHKRGVTTTEEDMQFLAWYQENFLPTARRGGIAEALSVAIELLRQLAERSE